MVQSRPSSAGGFLLLLSSPGDQWDRVTVYVVYREKSLFTRRRLHTGTPQGNAAGAEMNRGHGLTLSEGCASPAMAQGRRGARSSARGPRPAQDSPSATGTGVLPGSNRPSLKGCAVPALAQGRRKRHCPWRERHWEQ